jgi:hypothetical protein
MADLSRAMQSRKLLATLSGEAKLSRARLVTHREKYHGLQVEVATLEAKLKALETELSTKNNLVNKAQKEMTEIGLKIQYEEEKKAGLCIRLVRNQHSFHRYGQP